MDAPYRETKTQLNKWARDGVLAVEMQAASLFAFGVAKQASVASVAMVSNAVDDAVAQFDTGSQEDGLGVLKGIAQPDSFQTPLASLSHGSQRSWLQSRHCGELEPPR